MAQTPEPSGQETVTIATALYVNGQQITPGGGGGGGGGDFIVANEIVNTTR